MTRPIETRRPDGALKASDGWVGLASRLGYGRLGKAVARVSAASSMLALLGAGPALANAVYSPALGAPSCEQVGASCDSGTLLERAGYIKRDANNNRIAPELNQPNTASGCGDGDGLWRHTRDESIERIKVRTLDGQPMVSGATVRLDVTFYPYYYSPGSLLRLQYTGDGDNPQASFQQLPDYETTQSGQQSGLQTYSVEYTLPEGTVHRVRARIATDTYSLTRCDGWGYYEIDDLVFAVDPQRTSRNANSIADAVAQVYAKICPDENAPCLYQVPLLQLMSVRSLEIEEHTNWFRNFIGLHKIDAKDSAECFARGDVERECFQEGVVDTDTLFLGAADLETRDDRTFHYSWGIYSYDYQTQVGEEKQYYELVLVEPQERPDNQDEIAVIHMNSPDCLEAADFTLRDPFTNVRTKSACRGKLHLGAGWIDHPSRQEITYNHQYINMGELLYLNEVDGVTYKPYFSSTCSLKLDNDEVRAWLANPGDDKEVPVICALAGNIQQVNSLLHKNLIGDVNANNILAQSLWGFVGELGALLSEASLLSEAALLSEQGQNLRKVALTLEGVGLSADSLINGISIFDAGKDIKACRDAHANVTERHQCQEGPISDLLLSMMGLGMDVAGTVHFVTQLDAQTPGQTLESGDLIEMSELSPLLAEAKSRYADYAAADTAANPLGDVTPLPEFTLNEMDHHEDNVSARDPHLHPGSLGCP